MMGWRFVEEAKAWLGLPSCSRTAHTFYHSALFYKYLIDFLEETTELTLSFTEKIFVIDKQPTTKGRVVQSKNVSMNFDP